MKKILVVLVAIALILGSVSFVNANEVEDIELPTLPQLIADDYTSGMDFKELIEKYNLHGDNYTWFAYTFLATPTPKKTIHQAIAYDYCSGEDLNTIMDRFGLGTVDFDIGSLEPSKTIEEAIEYDWQNNEDREVLKERYRIDEDYIRWNLEKSIKEPDIDPKEIVINDWLDGRDYSELKEKHNFSDMWFLVGVKDLLVKR